jgi:hypothetical protein
LFQRSSVIFMRDVEISSLVFWLRVENQNIVKSYRASAFPSHYTKNK